MHILEIGARALERGDECALQRVLLGRETGQPLATVDKHVGQAFVAVHVEKGVDTGFVHRRAHIADFGTALQARRCPLAIEIGAGSVGAQIAADAAIGIHVRHDVNHRLRKERARDRVVPVEQAVE